MDEIPLQTNNEIISRGSINTEEILSGCDMASVSVNEGLSMLIKHWPKQGRVKSAGHVTVVDLSLVVRNNKQQMRIKSTQFFSLGFFTIMFLSYH